MSSLNKVHIIGRLGRDPEVKNMPNGDAVATLSVATSEKWKDKASGETKEATEWHRIVMFGRQAEVCGQYLKKGSLAYFEGKLKTRKWTDKEGVERYTTEINADRMQMLSGAGDSQGGGRDSHTDRPAAAPRQQQQASARSQSGIDDDIPF